MFGSSPIVYSLQVKQRNIII